MQTSTNPPSHPIVPSLLHQPSLPSYCTLPSPPTLPAILLYPPISTNPPSHPTLQRRTMKNVVNIVPSLLLADNEDQGEVVRFHVIHTRGGCVPKASPNHPYQPVARVTRREKEMVCEWSGRCLCVCVEVCSPGGTHVCVCVFTVTSHIHAHTYTCTHMHTHTCTHMHTHTCTHTHTHTLTDLYACCK